MFSARKTFTFINQSVAHARQFSEIKLRGCDIRAWNRLKKINRSREEDVDRMVFALVAIFEAYIYKSRADFFELIWSQARTREI